MQNPLVTQLGYPSDARLVIFHADDVGMCHGSNQAYLELCAAGILQTGSVMIPCPWSPELVQACQQNPTLDIGVHLTLTSEWAGYRWGPISTRDLFLASRRRRAEPSSTDCRRARDAGADRAGAPGRR
jgi:predicted glycoside hydrolase/deacetylase ChbG (UPF0249 family)